MAARRTLKITEGAQGCNKSDYSTVLLLLLINLLSSDCFSTTSFIEQKTKTVSDEQIESISCYMFTYLTVETRFRSESHQRRAVRAWDCAKMATVPLRFCHTILKMLLAAWRVKGVDVWWMQVSLTEFFVCHPVQSQLQSKSAWLENFPQKPRDFEHLFDTTVIDFALVLENHEGWGKHSDNTFEKQHC